MSPVPDAEEMCRTKHPPPLTIKFAKFSRKPTPGLMAVGGLPGEMVVRMLVSTRMRPQYGETKRDETKLVGAGECRGESNCLRPRVATLGHQ